MSRHDQPRGAAAARRGFSLVELSIEVAILAILAALLFPVFARARENARKTACASNLRQIGQALTMYIQDSSGAYPDSRLASDALDGSGCSSIARSAPKDSGPLQTRCWEDRLYLPGTGGGPPPGTAVAGYPARLLPYIRASVVFRCPSDPGVDRRLPGPERTSYSFRHAHDRYATQHGGLLERDIRSPAQLVVIFEEGWHFETDPYFWNSVDRGLKHANALFYDGHVKALAVDFVTGTNNVDNYDVDWWFNGPGIAQNGGWDLRTNPTDVR